MNEGKTLQVLVETLKYLRLIRKAGIFDARSYRRRYAGCCWWAGWFPALHYVLRGENLGYRPFEAFSPGAYLAANLDVAEHGAKPLRHYLEYGRSEGRTLRSLPLIYRNLDLDSVAKPCPARRPKSPSRIAAVVHVFHGELWPELAERLRTIPEKFDLFCTVVDRPENKGLAEQIGDEFERSQVSAIPNHGRDLFPFVWLLESGALDDYEAICKIHTKKSQHLQAGEQWRQHLARGILPSQEKTEKLVARFLADRTLGMVTAPGQVIEGIEWWDINRYRLEELLRRANLRVAPESVRFAAGSMYWVKPNALRRVRELHLTAYDFEPEDGQTDGTMAHLMERAFGVLTESGGYRLTDAGQMMEDRANPEALRFFQPTDERELQLPSFRTEALKPRHGVKYQLFVDECSVRGVIGWAVNHEAPDRRVAVELAIDQALVERRLADDYREDVANAGFGDGRFGFVFRIPEIIFDGETHGFEITVGDDAAAVFWLTRKLPRLESLGMAWRKADTVAGWCCNPTHPDRPPFVELIIGGYTVAVVTPHSENGEVFTNDRGQGIRFPFAFELKKEFSEEAWHGAAVRIGGSGIVLPWGEMPAC